jgi:hypothetical protein
VLDLLSRCCALDPLERQPSPRPQELLSLGVRGARRAVYLVRRSKPTAPSDHPTWSQLTLKTEPSSGADHPMSTVFGTKVGEHMNLMRLSSNTPVSNLGSRLRDIQVVPEGFNEFLSRRFGLASEYVSLPCIRSYASGRLNHPPSLIDQAIA